MTEPQEITENRVRIRDIIAIEIANVSDGYWNALITNADESWASSILSKYRVEADDLLAKLSAKDVVIQGRQSIGYCGETFWEVYPLAEKEVK
jgi:hypothetical protein